jgi:hypothetical protein
MNAPFKPMVKKLPRLVGETGAAQCLAIKSQIVLTPSRRFPPPWSVKFTDE